MTTTRRIVLRRRPQGAPVAEDFELTQARLEPPGAGEVRLRTLWLSLDPYMRGRMNDGPSYATPVALGAVMPGETIAVVEVSNAADRPVGTLVRAHAGWQTHAVLPAASTHPVDADLAPPQAFLGVLGMPGLTAYAGLVELGRPQAGETLVVAAATGPVGSLVGQLARRAGLRTVGVAGGAEKARLARETFGFDVALDHKGADFEAALADACPDGVDVYVELVGGRVLDAMLPHLNVHARVPVIGTVAHYNATGLPGGADRLPWLMRQVLVKRLAVQGLIVWDYEHLRERFVGEVAGLIRSGEVRYLEDVTDGLENAPAAFIGLLRGANRGKALVEVAADG